MRDGANKKLSEPKTTRRFLGETISLLLALRQAVERLACVFVRGVELDRLLVLTLGVLLAVQPLVGEAQVVVRRGALGVGLDGPLQDVAGRLVELLAQVGGPEV